MKRLFLNDTMRLRFVASALAIAFLIWLVGWADILVKADPQSFGRGGPITGTLTSASGAGSTVQFVNVQGDGTVAFQLESANFIGTVIFEATTDQTNWDTSIAFGIGNIPVQGGSFALSGATDRIYQLNSSGLTLLRIRCTAYTSGTLTVSVWSGSAVLQGSEVARISDLAATANPNANSVGSFPLLSNGTLYDQAVTANAASNTSGTGVAANGLMGWDSGNSLWRRLAVSAAGVLSVTSTPGTLTNNNAAPGSANVGVLAAVANAAAPTWTEGNQVLLSSDLAGNLRTKAIQGTSPWVVAGSSTPADAATLSTTAQNTYSLGAVYNGATQDMVRSANQASNTSGTGVPSAGVMGWDGTFWQKATHEVGTGTSAGMNVRLVGGGLGITVNNLGDGSTPGATTYGIPVYAFGMGWNGASQDRLRTPTKFNTAQATASGDTAVWTPAGGKKFRLMRYQIEVTDNATQTTPGVITILLRDATTATAFAHDVYVPSSALDTNGQLYTSGWQDLGNGFLSAAANNVLNCNLSAALTAGNVRVRVAGTEESMLAEWLLVWLLCNLWAVTVGRKTRRS